MVYSFHMADVESVSDFLSNPMGLSASMVATALLSVSAILPNLQEEM